MYLLDVSIRYLKYFCVLFVLFVLFVYAVSFIAMLHLHLWWFYFYSNGGDDDDKAVQMWSKSAIGAIFNIDYWTSHQMLDDNSAQIILMAMMIITIMMTMIRSKVAIFSKGDKYKFNKGTLTMASACVNGILF